MTKDHAVSTFGVAPRQRPFAVADEIARTAFEALLVVEQDATVVRCYEQLGWACDHTRPGRAVSTNLGFDNDVRFVRYPEVDSLHTVVEAQGLGGEA